MTMADAGFPLLIGDIGGTHARFAILPDARSELIVFESARTAEHRSLEEAIRQVVPGTTGFRPRSALLAVAAVVSGDSFPLTNADWLICPKRLASDLGLADVVAVNDFEAQALATVALESRDLIRIGGRQADAFAPRVVLGPGTGLGVAGLVRHADTWLPVAGEGGHVDIGPRDRREFEIFDCLERIDGRISGEQILCGRGLLNLYRATCRAGGVEPRFTEPESVSRAALADPESMAGEALALFVTILGRFAGDLALLFMAQGGVYLTGGISRHIHPVLQDGRFRRAFEDKAPFSALIASIPVLVMVDASAALKGLAAFVRAPGRFALDMRGRRWSMDR